MDTRVVMAIRGGSMEHEATQRRKWKGPSKLGRYSYHTVRLANMGIVGDDRADTQPRGSPPLLSFFFHFSSLPFLSSFFPLHQGNRSTYGSCLLLALFASCPFPRSSSVSLPSLLHSCSSFFRGSISLVLLYLYLYAISYPLL